MDRKSKILFTTMFILIVVSVSATFYKTVILENFDLAGVWIEFPTETSSYIWFVYENTEYELELEETEIEPILEKIADTVGLPVTELDSGFVAYIESSYEEALVISE